MTELIIATAAVLTISCGCSVLEAVLYSVSTSQIELLANQGRKSGKILKFLYSDIQRPISAILSLNTLANTGGAAIAGAAFAGVFGRTDEVYFTGALAVSVLIFSEIVPKTIGVLYARSLARFIARPIQWLVWFFAPFIWLNQFIIRLITRNALSATQDISAEEIEIIARMGRQAGSIAPEQERIIRNILNLHGLRAGDVMTPRTVVMSLDRNLTLAAAREEGGGWPHSRVPLYDESKESMIGVVMRREVFTALADGRDDLTLAALERRAHFVPELARLDQLLKEFLQRREHLFLVVDEYGDFAGIITLEDVLEEIVGVEIVGEFDPAVDMQERARQRHHSIIRRRP
jgi:CBS domain containing-hemolysin-like protein